MSNFYKMFPPLFNNTVIVRSWQDLQDLQEDAIYYIDGIIDMKGNQMTLPSGSGKVQFFGFSANIAGIIDSTDNYTMFNGGGQLFVNGIKFTTSGANSKVFDVTGQDAFNAIEFINTNFEDCTSLGEINAYRQGLFENVAIFGSSDGLTLSGVWGGGFRVITTIVRTFDQSNTGGKVFQAGTGLQFSSRFASDANIQVNGTSVAYSFTESNFVNDQDFQLLGGEISGTGTYVEGITVASTKSLWNSVGIDVTFPGAKMVVSSQATTTIPSSGTKVKIAGTFTYSNAIWFDTSIQNRMELLSTFSGSYRALGSLSLTSGNNRQIAIWLRTFNNSDVLQYEKAFEITTNGVGRAENVSIVDTIDLEEGYYVELWVSNETNSDNVTLLDNSNFFIEERKTV